MRSSLHCSIDDIADAHPDQGRRHIQQNLNIQYSHPSQIREQTGTLFKELTSTSLVRFTHKYTHFDPICWLKGQSSNESLEPKTLL